MVRARWTQIDVNPPGDLLGAIPGGWRHPANDPDRGRSGVGFPELDVNRRSEPVTEKREKIKAEIAELINSKIVAGDADSSVVLATTILSL